MPRAILGCQSEATYRIQLRVASYNVIIGDLATAEQICRRVYHGCFGASPTSQWRFKASLRFLGEISWGQHRPIEAERLWLDAWQVKWLAPEGRADHRHGSMSIEICYNLGLLNEFIKGDDEEGERWYCLWLSRSASRTAANPSDAIYFLCRVERILVQQDKLEKMSQLRTDCAEIYAMFENGVWKRESR